MSRTLRFGIGAGLVLITLITVVLLSTVFRPTAAPAGPPAITVTCLGGSEKTGLMADQEVKQILQSKYALTIDFRATGSLDQVLLSTDELKQRGVNCLWPSSASAQLVFEAKHNLADYPGYRAETVLNSPEVIYAGPEGVTALSTIGIVEKRNDRYFIVKMKELLLANVLKGKTWTDINAPTLRGPIIVESTNPTQSNSGFTLYLLQLSIVSTNDVYRSPTVQEARVALPTIKALYDAQGLQARSSGFGFDQWLLEGGELSSPLYAGYESQIIEKVVQNPQQATQILKDVRILYPDPTVYNEHPVLALNKDAGRLIDALKDPQIQSIAWKRYGFRSILLGVTDLTAFPNIPLADRIQTTKLPSAEVILMLQECLKNGACSK